MPDDTVGDERLIAADAGNGEGEQRPPLPSVRHLPVKRVIFLVAAAIGLYVVWPNLVQFFAAVPELRGISWAWFVLMGLCELASFACYWALMRLTLNEPRWFVVATTQMASNAFSRVVPGGAASGGPASYQLLVNAGAPRARTITGLTATTLLSTAVLLALPVLAVPAMLGGVRVERSLLRVLEFGILVFVLLVALGSLFLFSDRPLHLVGCAVQRVRNRLRRHGEPVIGIPAHLLDERDLIRGVLGDKWWQALPLAAGNWLFDFMALLAALAAAGVNPRLSLVLIAYVVAALLGMVPITPGGLGFVEVGLTATLGLAGVGAADATLATLAYRLVSYWLPIPVGLLAVFVYQRRFGRANGAARTAARRF